MDLPNGSRLRANAAPNGSFTRERPLPQRPPPPNVGIPAPPAWPLTRRRLRGRRAGRSYRVLPLAFPALLVVSVMACKDDVQSITVPPLDAGNDVDDLAPLDASDATPAHDADAARPVCNGKNPDYTPPPFHPKARQECTAAQIEAY